MECCTPPGGTMSSPQSEQPTLKVMCGLWSSDRARAEPFLGLVNTLSLPWALSIPTLDYFTSLPLVNPTQLSAAKVSARDA